MDIRDFEAITEIAGTGSFRLAAERMNTTQSTLSRLVSRVEDTLGTALFRRGWGGTETTAQGDLTTRAARQVMTDLTRCEDKLFGAKQPRPRLRRSLTLAQLDTVEALCRTGSTVQAARDLGCSQPTVSRVLGDMRAQLGLELFSRDSRGLSAHPAAQDLSELCLTVRAITAQLYEDLRRTDGMLSGRIAIGVLPFSAQTLISQAFAQIAEEHPNVSLICLPGTYPGLVEALRRRQIEGIMGLVRGETCPSDLQELPLFDEEFTIVARRDHPALQPVMDRDALARVHWIVPPHGSPVRAWFESLFEGVQPFPRVQTCEMLSFSASEDIIAAGNAFGLQTYGQFGIGHMHPALCRVEIDAPRRRVGIGLTVQKGRPEAPAMQMFRGLITRLAQAHEV